MKMVRISEDVATGLLFIALGGLFFWKTQELPIGTALRMGPGYFPLILSMLLGGLGAIVLVRGVRQPAVMPSGVAWRAPLTLTVSVVFYGMTMSRLGFLPALGVSVFLSTLASRKSRLRTSLAITVVVVFFAWAVFIKGIGLPLQLIGPWLAGH